MKIRITLFLGIFLACFTFPTCGQGVVPNGSFENWTIDPILTIELPDGWVGTQIRSSPLIIGTWPNTITKTNDAIEGSSAVLLETSVDSSGAWMFVGELMIDFDQGIIILRDGADFFERPESLTGFYKGFVEGDTAFIVTQLFSTRNMPGIAEARWEFSGAQSEYTPFTVDFTYVNETIPDSMFMAIGTDQETFLAGSIPGRANVGNALYLDGLAFELASGIKLPLFADHKLKLSPNPAVDIVRVELPKEIQGQKHFFVLYNAQGQKVANHELRNIKNVIISNLPTGKFYYQLFNESGILIDGGILMKVR